MIPRRFFWILDFTMVAFAFCLAYTLWPEFRPILNGMRFQWLSGALQPQTIVGTLPPFHSMAWILVLAGIAAVIALEIGEAYRPLLQQSRARVVITSVVAPIAAGGVITLVLFFEKTSSWSRFFLISFMVLAAILLTLFRMSLRQYFHRRRAAGFYTK